MGPRICQETVHCAIRRADARLRPRAEPVHRRGRGHDVQAIVEKPPRIATGVGVLGDLLHTVLPGAARALMNSTFRKAA